MGEWLIPRTPDLWDKLWPSGSLARVRFYLFTLYSSSVTGLSPGVKYDRLGECSAE